MKILLFGKNGQVGWELHRTLTYLGEVKAFAHSDLDLLDIDQLKDVILKENPNVIVNAAAYTNVEKAEVEVEKAYAINARAPGMMAVAAKATESLLIHFSTDYVFDGKKGSPYSEDDLPNPINVYGKSKLAGERKVQEIDGSYLIFRTSWVYSLRRRCFATKVLSWAKQNPELRIVDDQIGSPTWCRMLAEIINLIISQAGQHKIGWIEERKGIYHLAGKGEVSRFDWTKSLLEHDPQQGEHAVIQLIPAKSNEFPMEAERPAYSALGCQKVEEDFDIYLPPWEVQIPLALNPKGS